MIETCLLQRFKYGKIIEIRQCKLAEHYKETLMRWVFKFGNKNEMRKYLPISFLSAIN